jgi:hypothetical protein
MKSLLADIKSVKKDDLKHTSTVGGNANLTLMTNDKDLSAEDEKRREYFFQAMVDNWYEKIKDKTFFSHFTPIHAVEAKAIINYWETIGSKSNEPVAQIPVELKDLMDRVDRIIHTHFVEFSGVFVKLSTRSPKDSKTIFRKAEAAFQARLDEEGNVSGWTTSKENARLIAFSEEMAKANTVSNGREAVTILLDSWRVAEDLMYAFEDGKKEYSVSLVIRGWDARITPKCEFRGFVWDYRLTCVGQYWHSLYYPDLLAQKDAIGEDLLTFFETIKDSLPVPTAMLDLAWLGPGEVVLIEVNPLMEGLGSFKGSTGLFDYYGDADTLMGKNQFEIRVRTVEESKTEILSHMSLEWRKVVYGF